MTSIFVETVSKAISDYRQLLRRHLPQCERVTKLMELGLKQPDYENETALYRTAQRIVQDIEVNLDSGNKSYYTYSGVGNFGRYLKEFIGHYMIEGNQVIHRAQKASRALIDSIQLIGLPTERLTPDVLETINKNSMTIAHFGSEEQSELYKENLERYYRERGSFFGPLLRYFAEQLRHVREVSEAA
ncbi:MAG: hypothetical protein KDH94_01420 [Coxiellaceae bacterium]|nr:hypothetical protein [Coxiellaceae bacterium]